MKLIMITEENKLVKHTQDSLDFGSDYIELSSPKDENTQKKEIIKSTYFNDLSGKEWTAHSKSVQIFNSPITKKRARHGAAYPISLAKHFVEIYSKEGDTIFDPFAGVGTTLDAANILKRHSQGIELNPDFIKLFEQGIDIKDGLLNPDYDRVVHNDTALNLEKYINPNSIDLIVTSPPYSNLLNKIRENFGDKDYVNNTYKNQSRKLAKAYSESEDDLGNVPYDEYLLSMKNIFNSLMVIAKPGTYNVWVVRDFRDLDNSIPYINLHGDLIKIATETGWIMWDLIIWDQSNQRKLVMLGGKKSRRFYFNIGHSFILVFRKNMKGEKF